jgi:hypothetical protein
VDALESFRKLARSIPRDKFAERFSHPFLVKAPVTAIAGDPEDAEDDPWGEKISFTTRVIPAEAEPDLIDEHGPVAREWRVAEVKKRDGNPFPDRISVGRAKNCDVVLRFPSVSKLHAHFLVRPRDATLRLEDQQSANRTFVNGKALRPGVATAIRSGDKIRFGALAVEFLDANAFHTLLLRV